MIGLFFAFVIGNALMLVTWLVQGFVGYVYQFAVFVAAKCRKHILLPLLIWHTHSWKDQPPTPTNPNPAKVPRFKPRPWISYWYVKTTNAVGGLISSDEKADYEWWDAMVRQLLLKRFGMREDDLPAASLRPLQDVLVLPVPEETRGSALMNSLQATGWGGLLATRFATQLRHEWYVAPELFLIGCGLLHSYEVSRALLDPALGNLLRLRAILREFPQLESVSPNPPPEAVK